MKTFLASSDERKTYKPTKTSILGNVSHLKKKKSEVFKPFSFRGNIRYGLTARMRSFNPMGF